MPFPGQYSPSPSLALPSSHARPLLPLLFFLLSGDQIEQVSPIMRQSSSTTARGRSHSQTHQKHTHQLVLLMESSSFVHMQNDFYPYNKKSFVLLTAYPDIPYPFPTLRIIPQRTGCFLPGLVSRFFLYVLNGANRWVALGDGAVNSPRGGCPLNSCFQLHTAPECRARVKTSRPLSETASPVVFTHR